MFAKSAIVAVTALAALGLFTASAPAQTAGADGDTVQVTVKYGDLDLSSPAGASEMLRRIHTAATRICGPAPSDRLSFQRQYDECVRETVNRAVINLGNPSIVAASGMPTALAAATPRG
jgi:UrcA family protein